MSRCICSIRHSLVGQPWKLLSAKFKLRLQWLKERVKERHIVLIRILGLPIDGIRLLHIVEHNLMGEAIFNIKEVRARSIVAKET